MSIASTHAVAHTPEILYSPSCTAYVVIKHTSKTVYLDQRTEYTVCKPQVGRYCPGYLGIHPSGG